MVYEKSSFIINTWHVFLRPPSQIWLTGGSSLFFKSSRRLRQGDSLSPLLFLVVMEALHKLIERAKEVGLVRGIQIGRAGKQIEISHLFFADDNLIFSQSDADMMLN